MKYVSTSFFVSIICAAVIVSTAPSYSATITDIFSGDILLGADNAGLFGQVNGTLGAQNPKITTPFLLSLTYDPSIGFSKIGASELVQGGTGYGAPSPVSSATLTISGVAYAMPTSYVGQLEFCVSCSFGGANLLHVLIAGPTYTQFVIDVWGDLPQISLTTPTTLDLTKFVQSSDFVIFSGPAGNNALAYGSELSILSLNASAAPEPSTWAMTLLGFVAVGLAGYRTVRKAPRWHSLRNRRAESSLAPDVA